MSARPRTPITASVLALGLALTPTITATAAPATPTAHVYKNCTEIHKHWSGGIAKNGINRNKTPSGSRALKGTVKHSTALYNANKKSDRDKDGIACEKS